MVQGVRASGIGGPSSLGRDGGRVADGHFPAIDIAAAPSQKARLSAIATVGLESLLTLQAVGDADEKDRAARKRGTAMVSALSKLQRAMLAADDPAGALRDLRELTEDGPEADDPRLAAIVKAIVLRSRVEIARRGRRTAPD